MAGVLVGNHSWKMTRDEDGHREYKLVQRVRMQSTLQGPAVASQTPGLYLPGALWIVDGDVDFFAWCRQDLDVTPELEGEPNEYFKVEQTFSTKPLRRCGDIQVEDPLLEPMKVSGSFVKFNEEASTDRFGNPIVNSAHEQIRGPKVEFDRNRPQVKIEQNVPQLQLDLLAQFVDCVNDSTLWNLPPRCVKLSNVSWEQLYHGQCEVYYKRTLEFDINFETFDRLPLDEGTKVLNGHWGTVAGTGTGSGGPVGWVLDNIDGAVPDPNNPQHFIRLTDRNGNLISGPLNGRGLPASVNYAVSVHYYVSIVDPNHGYPLTDTTKWRPVAGPIVPQEWQSGTTYLDGTFVYVDAASAAGPVTKFYVALVDNTGFNPVINSDKWGDIKTPPRSRGIYKSTEFYGVGDYVRTQVVGVTDVGTVKVEKYPEANMLLLNIPPTLP